MKARCAIATQTGPVAKDKLVPRVRPVWNGKPRQIGLRLGARRAFVLQAKRPVGTTVAQQGQAAGGIPAPGLCRDRMAASADTFV